MEVIRTRRMLRKTKTLSVKVQLLMDFVLVESLLYLCVSLKGIQDFSLYGYPAVMVPLLMWFIYLNDGIYRHFSTLTGSIMGMCWAWSKVMLIMVAWAFTFKHSELFSREVILSWFVFSAVAQVTLHMATNYAMLFYLKSQNNMIPSIIVGTGSLASYLTKKLNENPWTQHKIIGAVLASGEAEDAWDVDGVPCIGVHEELKNLVEEHQVRRVYFALPLRSSHEIREMQLELLDLNVDIIWAPDIFGLHLISPSVKEVAGVPLYYLSESPMVDEARFTKVFMDKILALVAVLLLSPLMMMIACAVKLTSPGPVFFRQKRHGLDGIIINVLKFRSMKIHDEKSDGVTQATRGDVRITKVGRFLRRTSMDELPQLFNVLKGDMSLVGPRPHALKHNEFYTDKVSAYMSRHRILPGITGLAQVNGCRGETDTLDKMERRVEYDLVYINNWSLVLDIKIMIKTLFTLLSKNAY